MSVLIKGMKMPQGCLSCDFCNPFTDEPYCRRLMRRTPKVARIKDCPLVPVPAADVQEVRYGRWEDIEHAPNGLLYVTCSVCGKRQTVETTNYCGNCGSFNGKDNLNEKL